MKVLLTGGRGMVGRAILRAYSHLQPNTEVVAPTRDELDLLDGAAVREFLLHGQFDLVIHAAAKVGGIAANIQDPVGFLHDNTLLNLNVLHGAHQAGVTKVLYLGSSCMYPKDYAQPLREEYLLAAPLEPTNEGYALAKIAGAKLCEYLNKQVGTHFKTIIPCNLYGPGDHFDATKSHLIAAALLKLHEAKIQAQPHIEIWGDGSARREFLYVDDLANWIVENSGSIEELPDYLNVGFGDDHSVLEYYRAAAQAVGYQGEFMHDLSKPVGMKQKLMDSSRAKSLGWSPTTSVHDGIAQTYQYFLSTL